jgi:hypothetical protein
MYDYSQKCLYCFNDYSCDKVDSINHATQVLGICVLLPFLGVLMLQQFNEKLKYAMVPFILINGLFMFVVVILTGYSYVIFIYYKAQAIMRILHILNLVVGAFVVVMIWFVDKYMSTDFDYYEES